MRIPEQWRQPLAALFLLTALSIGVFFESWRSIVTIWINSETFAHGFLVAPISLWLILTRRHHYENLQPRPSYTGLMLLLLAGFAWLAAELTHVLVVGQWALVGMLICAYWVLLGTQVYTRMLFPILFLFLMVPFGEDFVPFLMEFTATFVVWMLRLTGISVYREGLHFTLTSGNWSVVDACSGIRYLIASLTLGAVYAYLNYSSYKKRLWFMLAALLTPILANGLRAYMIVMIGHLSSMKLATGVDHIIYGWLFFGLVMLLMFYIGSFWHDEPGTEQGASAEVNLDLTNRGGYPRFWPLLLTIVVAMAVWPVLAQQMQARQAHQAEMPAAMLRGANSQTATPDWGWEPQFTGVINEARQYWSDGGSTVGLYFASFGDESQGGELVNSQNILLHKNSQGWRMVATDKRLLVWSTQQTQVDETVISSERGDLLVWRWYRVGSANTANNYWAKGLQLLKRLTGDNGAELLIVIYTDTPHNDYQQARERLQRMALACCG